MSQLHISKPDLLFDVDGVLVHPPFRFRDYLEHNYGITPEVTAPFFRSRFTACVTGHAELRDELRPYLGEWGWQGTVSSFIEAWMREDSTPDTGMLEFVVSLKLRGFKCHVASVQERNRATFLRHTVGFDKLFDQTFFSCDIGAAKPDPAFYIKTQEQLARPPNELLLIDDSFACIEAARAAGWQAFHYKGPADRARLAKTIAGLDSIKESRQ
jgi:putative hydrolase of the HAD superfamily